MFVIRVCGDVFLNGELAGSLHDNKWRDNPMGGQNSMCGGEDYRFNSGLA